MLLSYVFIINWFISRKRYITVNSLQNSEICDNQVCNKSAVIGFISDFNFCIQYPEYVMLTLILVGRVALNLKGLQIKKMSQGTLSKHMLFNQREESNNFYVFSKLLSVEKQ